MIAIAELDAGTGGGNIEASSGYDSATAAFIKAEVNPFTGDLSETYCYPNKALSNNQFDFHPAFGLSERHLPAAGSNYLGIGRYPHPR